MTKQLNIVSFDVPYPPNYGGAIDVFYKLKALYELGIKIHLHAFEYGRGEHKELLKFCKTVTYYKRRMSFISYFSPTPFIVKSRENHTLIENLNNNKFPVFFEGLHTTFGLSKINAKVYVRTHNIEHFFFKGQALSEQNIFKKLFFHYESIRFKYYEKILKNVDNIFTISPSEQQYFHQKYGEKTQYIPAFHRSDYKTHTTQKGEFVLWHGDLRVSDNIRAANELIDIFKSSNFKLVIASSFEEKSVLASIKMFKNIDFVNIKQQNVLDNLLEKAHVNILLTHQKTGIKLKLLYSLYQGKFIIANNKMIDDTGLENLCEKANSSKEILAATAKLFSQEFTATILTNRKEVLQSFCPKKSAKKIEEIIF